MTAYQTTLDFLQSLEQCGSTTVQRNQSLLENLFESLGTDGFTIQPVQKIIQNGIIHRNLRGLAEATVDGVNMVDVSFVLICVIFAALASGLTQGLLSLDLMEMEIKARSGTPQEKKFAAKLIPIISNHHLLLVTLMLWNASATEALPVFLSALVPEYLAIIISVTLVLFVGEIIPASILTGPRQLQIASTLTPLVYFVLFIFFPIAYPISYCLDIFIGHDSGMTMYNRKEISTLMRLQREEGVKRAAHTLTHSRSKTHSGHDNTITVNDLEHLFEEEEVTIIDGALKYREMAVSQVMTPEDAVYMISVEETLSYKIIYDIFKSGYSRIPVFDKDRSDIVGLILAKDLIFIDPEDETPVRNFVDLFGRKPAVVWHDSKLGETLSMFKAEKSHMAIVRDVKYEGEADPVYEVVGIITLEDIVEEILGTEIEDETDVTKGGASNAHISNTYRDSMMLQPAPQMMTERDPELARIQTLTNAKLIEDCLSDEEVHSIGIYLFTNVPQIQRMFKDNMLGLQKLVRSSGVVSMIRKAEEGASPAQEDYLYRKGKISNTCALILSGSVEVVFEEGESKTRGPWTTLAAEALEAPDGTYLTNFTAHITSENLRYLRMSNFQEKAANLDENPKSPIKRLNQLQRMRSFGGNFGSRALVKERGERTFSNPNKQQQSNNREVSDDLTAADLYGVRKVEFSDVLKSHSSEVVEPENPAGSRNQPPFNVGSYLRGPSLSQALATEARFGKTSNSGVLGTRRDVGDTAEVGADSSGLSASGIHIAMSSQQQRTASESDSESTGVSTRNPLVSWGDSVVSDSSSPSVTPVTSLTANASTGQGGSSVLPAGVKSNTTKRSKKS